MIDTHRKHNKYIKNKKYVQVMLKTTSTDRVYKVSS